MRNETADVKLTDRYRLAATAGGSKIAKDHASPFGSLNYDNYRFALPLILTWLQLMTIGVM